MAWIQKWVGDAKLPVAVRLIASAIASGIFFSGFDFAIQILIRRGHIRSLVLGTHLIISDKVGCLIESLEKKSPNLLTH